MFEMHLLHLRFYGARTQSSPVDSKAVCCLLQSAWDVCLGLAGQPHVLALRSHCALLSQALCSSPAGSLTLVGYIMDANKHSWAEA